MFKDAIISLSSGGVMIRYLILISLCLTQNLFADLEMPSDDEVLKKIKSLDYEKGFKVDEFKLYRMKRKYKIFKIKLTSTHPWTKDDFSTEFLYYKSVKQEKRPLLIIIPPVVDITPFDKIWAHQFVQKHGYNVFILKYSEKD